MNETFYMAIVVLGAVIVLFAAVMVFRSNRQGKASRQAASVETKEETGAPKESRRSIINKIREMRKRDPVPEKMAEAENGLPELVPAAAAVYEPPAAPPVVERPVASVPSEPAPEQYAPAAVETEPAPQAEASHAEETRQEEPAPVEEENTLNIFAADAQDSLEALSEAVESGQDAQPEIGQPEKKEGDNIFDLFTADNEEESEVSKFAANLQPVDITNLLNEARNLIGDFHRTSR